MSSGARALRELQTELELTEEDEPLTPRKLAELVDNAAEALAGGGDE